MILKLFEKLILLIIFCCCNLTLHGQIIKGTITDSLNKPITNATITTTAYTSSTKILTFAISNKNGDFNIDSPKLNSFSLNIKALSYKSVSLPFTSKNSSEKLDITLQNNIDALDEVILVSKKKPKISIRNDTTIFNADSFKSGEVKVIEDLLKNLPGFDLRDDGKFTFKGKVVESLLLDGTDVFDSNYTVATKNLNANLIKEVEAIENYFKNPLLTGLSETDAVAVNLKIKAGVADVVSTNDIATGIENKYQARSTLLTVAEKLKSFNNFSFNNIGIENSPYNYYKKNNVFSIDKDAINKDNTIIRGNGFANDFSAERARLNNNLYGSLNGVFNINPKLTIKINGDYKTDKLSQIQTESTNYFTENTLQRNKTSNIESTPNLFTGSLEGNMRLNDKSSLFYNGRIFVDETKTNVTQILNGEKAINLQNDNNFIQKHKILYTNRINENEALIFQSTFNNHNLEQNYFLANNNQSVLRKTIYNSNQIKYFKSNLKNDLKVTFGYNYEESNLISFNSLNNNINNLTGHYNYPWFEFKTNTKLGLLTVNTTFNVKYFRQRITEMSSSLLESSKLQFNPKVRFNYKISENGSIKLNGSYTETNLSLNNQYQNSIIASPTLRLKNGFNNETLKSLSLQTGYSYYNLLEFTQLNLMLNYNKRFNAFTSELIIDPDETSTTKILRNFSTDNISLDAGTDVFVPIIKSNLKVTTSLGFESYNNTLNNENLRDVNSYSNYNSLKIKSGFFGIFNFENTITNTNLKFKSTISNEIYGITNNLYLYLKPTRRIKLGTTIEYYHPDLSTYRNFYFLDFDLSYTSKNKNIIYSLVSKNITAQEATVENIIINDILQSSRSYTINNPFLLLKVEFSF